MAVRMTKAWLSLDEAMKVLHGHMGVYQLADAAGTVVFIGYAGGRSQFGLKGEIRAQAELLPDAVQMRYEITTAYMSRFRELMMVHIADHGEPPVHNPPVKLGRLSPA